MNVLLFIVRAVHLNAAISLAGTLGFVPMLVPQALQAMRSTILRLGWISLGLLILSAPVWLLIVAQEMSGDPIGVMWEQGIVRVALTGTQFGHVWIFRMVLALLLMPCFMRLGRSRLLDVMAAILAGLQLAAMAWQGHAGADTGEVAAAHLLADVAHLVAAGLWLGGLLPLAMLLRAPLLPRFTHLTIHRFSTLGIICVTILLVTGVVNSVVLVGSWPAMFGTWYGWLLWVKLALVAAMLRLAYVNRRTLGTALAPKEMGRRIARNAIGEAGFGLGVVAVVGLLGAMVPGAHQPIHWLLPVRIAYAWWPPQFHVLAATPASYAISPERFCVESIAQGASLYAQHCASCHGEDGQGDGPMSADLPTVPLDFASSQIAAKSDGDLYWAITAGVPQSMMPGFATLSEAQRWDLVIYLNAQRQARVTSSTILAEPIMNAAPLAPDFVLPTPASDGDTLSALLAAGRDVLLAFIDPSKADGRVEQLKQWHDALTQNHVIVVVIETPSPIVDAYALYEHRPQLDAAPPAADSEFLIDRKGYIRARWHPGETPDWTQWLVQLDQINAMRRLKLAPVTPAGHAHEG